MQPDIRREPLPAVPLIDGTPQSFVPMILRIPNPGGQDPQRRVSCSIDAQNLRYTPDDAPSQADQF